MSAQVEEERANSVPNAGDEESHKAVPNMGNPVFTAHKELIQTATITVTSPGTPEELAELQHPMYATTSSEYGKLAPTIECVPTSFHGRSQKFSKHLSQSGMYRNHSLNTARDHTRV